MTRKKFIKTLMGRGVSRNRAREEAERIKTCNERAAVFNRIASDMEWKAIEKWMLGDRSVSLDPIPRMKMESYREALQQGE